MTQTTEKRWGYFFVRTDDGLRTRRLRDYPWPIRIGTVLAACVLVALAIARGASGATLHHSPRAHISVAQAERAVVRYFGPSTTASCHRASPHSALCDYSIPEAGGLVVAEDGGPPPGPWEGICRVIVQRGRYRVSSPL